MEKQVKSLYNNCEVTQLDFNTLLERFNTIETKLDFLMGEYKKSFYNNMEYELESTRKDFRNKIDEVNDRCDQYDKEIEMLWIGFDVLKKFFPKELKVIMEE